MKKLGKGLLKLAVEILLATVVLMCISISVEGMFLLGLPKEENIRKVEISYPAVTAETKVLFGEEDIERCLSLTGFFKYKVFTRAEDVGTPTITMTFWLEDDTTVTVAANETTLWWKDKTYVLKHPKTFLNLTEGIYFLQEIQATQAQ